jgi:hypothetical protein
MHINGETEELELAVACREGTPGKGAPWASIGVAHVETTRGVEHDAKNTRGQPRPEQRLGLAEES